MQKGNLKKKRTLLSNFFKRNHYTLLFHYHKISEKSKQPMSEERHALRFISICSIGFMLLIIGGFNLHNNMVVCAFLGITSIIASIFLLSQGMEQCDIANSKKRPK